MGQLASFPTCPARTAMFQACVKEVPSKLVCHAALVHKDRRPELHTVNVEPHETTVIRDFDISFTAIFSCGKMLELICCLVEINATLLKCMVDTGAEINVLPSGLVHTLDIRLTTVVLKAWNSYALQIVGEAEYSVLYKGIAWTAVLYC